MSDKLILKSEIMIEETTLHISTEDKVALSARIAGELTADRKRMVE